MPRTDFRFDGKNPDAQDQARTAGSRLVVEADAKTRAGLNAITHRIVRDGIPAHQGLRLIQDTVGLTSRQSLAVANYRAALARPRMNLSVAQIEKRTAKYAALQHKRRARTIARTETMGALNRGTLVNGRQKWKEGFLKDPVKVWKLTADEKLCPICAPLANETVPFPETFSNGLDAPPAHPNCRCSVLVKEKPLTAETPAEADYVEWQSAYGAEAGDLARLATKLRAQGINVRLPHGHTGPDYEFDPTGRQRLVREIMQKHSFTESQANRVFTNILEDAVDAMEAGRLAGRPVGKFDIRFEDRPGTSAGASTEGFHPQEAHLSVAAAGDHITYNATSGWWKSRNYHTDLRAKQFNGYAGVREISSDAPGYYTTHEMGHVAHLRRLSYSDRVRYHSNQTDPDNIRAWRGATDNYELANPSIPSAQLPSADTLPARIRASVSAYAATNPLEFIAEMHAGLTAGKAYPADLMEFYRFLDGPSWD